MKPLDSISWPLIIVLILTLGLAPYIPEPHIWQKINMLLNRNLSESADVFDLVFHGTPWLLAAVKLVRG